MKGLCMAVLLALAVGLTGCVAPTPNIDSTRTSCYANEAAAVAAITRAIQDGTAVPADWNGAMTAIVPKYLAVVPTCPGGGTYSMTFDGGVPNPICSLHGSPGDPATRP